MLLDPTSLISPGTNAYIVGAPYGSDYELLFTWHPPRARPLQYFIPFSLDPMRWGPHVFIPAYATRYLFKCHPFFPARIPEGNTHRTPLCPAHALPQPRGCQQRGRGLQKHKCSVFRSNRDTSRQNLSVAHPETTRGDEHRRCS